MTTEKPLENMFVMPFKTTTNMKNKIIENNSFFFLVVLKKC